MTIKTEDEVQPERSFCPHFTFNTFETGTNPSNEEQVYALRYQVYCLERFFLPAEDYPYGLEKDEFDAFSTNIAVYSLTGLLVGSARLVTPHAGESFPFQKHCTELFAEKAHPQHHECAEISRLVISKLYRRRTDDTVYGVSSDLVAEDSAVPQNGYLRGERSTESDRRKLQPEIFLGIMKQLYQQTKRQGIRYWYMALEKPLERLLHRIFFFSLEAIGKPADYFGPVVPCILSVEHFEDALSQGDPILFTWFQSGLVEEDTQPTMLMQIPEIALPMIAPP